MKIIITESQLSKLITEQTVTPSFKIIEKEKKYTNKKKYDIAIEIYNALISVINYTESFFNFIDSSPREKDYNLFKQIQKKARNSEEEIIRLLQKYSKYNPGFEKSIDSLSKDIYYPYVIYKSKNKILFLKKSYTSMDWSKMKAQYEKVGEIGELRTPIGPFTIEKPIFKDTSIKPLPTIPVSQKVDNKQTTDTTLRPNPITKFSVSWREDTPSGDVYQNTHYFSDYNEWKEFVNQHPNPISQNENGSKTEAQALYSGLHADISKDKTVKGPR